MGAESAVSTGPVTPQGCDLEDRAPGGTGQPSRLETLPASQVDKSVTSLEDTVSRA